MRKITANPFLLFLPALIVYVLLVFVLHKDAMKGDEGRYYMYAQNLLHGFYSPRGEVYLWNGPGYPLFLVPFLLLRLPLMGITLFNALFQYLSVVFLYKTIRLYASQRKALLFALFWACYYIAFKEMALIYTESLTLSLITAFHYCVARSFCEPALKKYQWIAGILLGYIVLTKVIFAYVVLVLLMLTVPGMLLLRKLPFIKTAMILVIALLINLPYLFYTYHLTHKPLYWANSGGSSLYWASSPFAGEFGDWNNENFDTYCNIDTLLPCNSALIARNHEADFKIFRQYNGVTRDEAFKRKAMENIRQHPLKYLKNYMSNAGRMLFGVPQSFFYQRFQNLLRIPPNAIVFTFIIFSGMFTLMRIRRIRFEMLFLVSLAGIYFFGSATLSADQRQFYIIVPAILLWTAYIFQEFIRFRLTHDHVDH